MDTNRLKEEDCINKVFETKIASTESKTLLIKSFILQNGTIHSLYCVTGNSIYTSKFYSLLPEALSVYNNAK